VRQQSRLCGRFNPKLTHSPNSNRSWRESKRGVDLISDVLPFGRLWYTKPDDAIGYAMHYSRSHAAVIRVYDALAA